MMTDPKDLTCLLGNARGQTIEPDPYTGKQEEFNINIIKEELERLKDKDGDIQYYKVVEWLLPKFDRLSF